MRIISLDELLAWRQENLEFNLIDVRLEDDFNAGRIPGAKNACVLNVSFLSDLAALGCEREQPIVVYGECADSHESRLAAGKLVRAGFVDVREFRGGLGEWREAGQPVDGAGPATAQTRPSGTLAINLEESRVEWLGRNLLNKHMGTIGLKSGQVEIKEGRLVGGEFVIDMNLIQCADIGDSKMSQILINHLRSDDFFDVERHPEASYRIQEVKAVPGATPGLPDVEIVGELNLRGKSHPLVFSAVTGLNAEARFAAQAALAFDRTLWDSIYGSGKFFKNVGMHLVNDLIEVQVRLLA